MPLQTGACAEGYVYFRLLTWGYDVHFASGINTQFDLWINHEGKPIRIQVKGSLNLERGKRGDNTGKFAFKTAKGCSTKFRYAETDYDILAMVAVSQERAYFTTAVGGKTTRVAAKRFDEEWEKASWRKAIDEFT